jgi:integrase
VFTSNFATSRAHPGAVAICRGIPPTFTGHIFDALRPSRAVLRLARPEFENAYAEQLSALDPATVWRALHALAAPEEPVLLCYEPHRFYCHRRICAEWLEQHLDVMIPELGYDRADTLPVQDSPSKPPSTRWVKRPPPSPSTQLTDARLTRPTVTGPIRPTKGTNVKQEIQPPRENLAATKHERTRGTGSIYQRGRLLWIQFYDHGLCRQESAKTAERKVAEKLLIKRLGEIEANTYVAPKIRKVRVSELAEAWLADCKVRQSRSLSDQNSRWLKRLKPFFGVKQASAVSTAMLTRYVESRQQARAANATINRELSDLRRMYYFGLESKTVHRDAIPTFNLLDESGNVRRGFVEERDYQSLVAAAAGPSLLWLRAMLAIGREWGWRKGELLKLRVSAVNMQARTIELSASQTKNRRPRKAKMLSPEILALVGELILGKQGNDYLFTRSKPNTSPAPVLESRNAWHSLCCRAGLGRMVHRACYDELVQEFGKDDLQLSDLDIVKRRCPRCERLVKWSDRKYVGLLFHDLRRSAVRDMIRGGTSEKIAMTITGHSTTSVFKRYDIVDERDLEATARRQEEYHRRNREDLEKEGSPALIESLTTTKPLQSSSETTSDSQTPVKPQTATLQ